MRPSWVEIDLAAIRANASAIAAEIAPTELCAVVKADGYGHGDVPAAGAAVAGGARWLAVALVEEAARLRDAAITEPILLLSEQAHVDTAEVIALDLVQTAYRWDFASAIAGEASASGSAPYPIHIKVDTGMHRVGAPPRDGLDLARRVVDDPRLRLAGVWTHLAVSEEDPEFTNAQLAELDDFLGRLRAAGIDPGTVHAANTAGALDHPAARRDLARVGLGVYGLRPAPDTGPGIALRPAMRVVSHVAHRRRLPAGSRPSYGRIRPLPAEGYVVTVPIGYADGVARRLGATGGSVLIRGVRYPFAGNVTMDQIVVSVGDDPVEVGEEVVLLGAQGDDAISADEWATRLDTINYEIVCDFGPRLPRRYVGAGS